MFNQSKMCRARPLPALLEKSPVFGEALACGAQRNGLGASWVHRGPGPPSPWEQWGGGSREGKKGRGATPAFCTRPPSPRPLGHRQLWGGGLCSRSSRCSQGWARSSWCSPGSQLGRRDGGGGTRVTGAAPCRPYLGSCSVTCRPALPLRVRLLPRAVPPHPLRWAPLLTCPTPSAPVGAPAHLSDLITLRWVHLLTRPDAWVQAAPWPHAPGAHRQVGRWPGTCPLPTLSLSAPSPAQGERRTERSSMRVLKSEHSGFRPRPCTSGVSGH